jgi:hypothetical protein
VPLTAWPFESGCDPWLIARSRSSIARRSSPT